MNLRQAAQMALEALEQFSEISDFTPAMAVHAITALRAALAEPEREQQQATIDFLTRAYDILKKEVDELHQLQRDQIADAIRSRK